MLRLVQWDSFRVPVMEAHLQLLLGIMLTKRISYCYSIMARKVEMATNLENLIFILTDR